MRILVSFEWHGETMRLPIDALAVPTKGDELFIRFKSDAGASESDFPDILTLIVDRVVWPFSYSKQRVHHTNPYVDDPDNIMDKHVGSNLGDPKVFCTFKDD